MAYVRPIFDIGEYSVFICCIAVSTNTILNIGLHVLADTDTPSSPGKVGQIYKDIMAARKKCLPLMSFNDNGIETTSHVQNVQCCSVTRNVYLKIFTDIKPRIIVAVFDYRRKIDVTTAAISCSGWG